MVAARACCWTLELPAAAAGCHPVVKNRIKKAEKNNKRRDTQTSNYYTTAQQISLRELGPFVLCVCRWCSPDSISNMRFFFLFCSYIVPTVNRRVPRPIISTVCVCVCVCCLCIYACPRLCFVCAYKVGPLRIVSYMFSVLFFLFPVYEMSWNAVDSKTIRRRFTTGPTL
jgi:hypothetical protein